MLSTGRPPSTTTNVNRISFQLFPDTPKDNLMKVEETPIKKGLHIKSGKIKKSTKITLR